MKQKGGFQPFRCHHCKTTDIDKFDDGIFYCKDCILKMSERAKKSHRGILL